MLLDPLNIAAIIVVSIFFTLFLRNFLNEGGPLLLSVFILSSLLYILFGDPMVFLLTYLSATTALLLYGNRFYVSFLLLLAVSLYVMFSSGVQEVAISISLGTFTSLLMSYSLTEKIKRNNSGRGAGKAVEIRRDVFQIGTGIVTLLFLIFLPINAGEAVVIILMLLLYLVGNYSHLNRDGRISGILYSMERADVDLGLGSIILAAGVLLIFGMVRDSGVVYAGIFLVLVADPVATIAGKLVGGEHLPYNRKKTFSGLGFSMLSSLLFITIICGVNYIPYAIVGTLVESASQGSLDDNITVPLSVVILDYFLMLF